MGNQSLQNQIVKENRLSWKPIFTKLFIGQFGVNTPFESELVIHPSKSNFFLVLRNVNLGRTLFQRSMGNFKFVGKQAKRVFQYKKAKLFFKAFSKFARRLPTLREIFMRKRYLILLKEVFWNVWYGFDVQFRRTLTWPRACFDAIHTRRLDHDFGWALTVGPFKPLFYTFLNKRGGLLLCQTGCFENVLPIILAKGHSVRSFFTWLLVKLLTKRGAPLFSRLVTFAINRFQKALRLLSKRLWGLVRLFCHLRGRRNFKTFLLLQLAPRQLKRVQKIRNIKKRRSSFRRFRGGFSRPSSISQAPKRFAVFATPIALHRCANLIRSALSMLSEREATQAAFVLSSYFSNWFTCRYLFLNKFWAFRFSVPVSVGIRLKCPYTAAYSALGGKSYVFMSTVRSALLRKWRGRSRLRHRFKVINGARLAKCVHRQLLHSINNLEKNKNGLRAL